MGCGRITERRHTSSVEDVRSIVAGARGRTDLADWGALRAISAAGTAWPWGLTALRPSARAFRSARRIRGSGRNRDGVVRSSRASSRGEGAL